MSENYGISFKLKILSIMNRAHAFLTDRVKVLLGWLSLLMVIGNEKKQAIHAQIVGSVALEEIKTISELSEDGLATQDH